MLALLANERGKHPTCVFTYECRRPRVKGVKVKREAGKRYPFSRDGWRRDWYAALAAAGIDDFRFHDGRHTAATRTLLTGM